MNTLRYARVLFAASLFCSTSVLADDSKGRLPDGRAYRTDSQGNQLVDYIAELEMMNDALRRQVSGLEVEVEQKQAVIDKKGSAPLVERDLVSAKAPVAPVQVAECKQIPCDCTPKIQEKVRELEIQNKQHETEFLRRINTLQSGKNEDLAIAQQKIERLMGESAQKDALLKSYEQGVQTVAKEKGRVQTALDVKNQELATLREEASKVEDEVAELSRKVTQLQSEREMLFSQEGALRKVLDEKKRTIAEIKEATHQVEETSREVQLQEVKVVQKTEEVQPAVVQAPVVEAAPAMRASYSMARDSAFDALRGRLTTNLNQIQGLIASRDRMYSEYMKGSQVVAFKPAAARSTRGLTIPQIRTAIQEAQTARELSLLTREVNEIRSKIDFDIGMMERVKRLR